MELHSALANLKFQLEETHQDHCRLTKSRPQEAKGAQCIEVDHSIERMKKRIELNSTALGRASIEEEG